MALIFVDGFDAYTSTDASDFTQKWETFSNSANGVGFQSTEGKFGGGTATFINQGSSSFIEKDISNGDGTDIAVGFWFRKGDVFADDSGFMSFTTSNGYILEIRSLAGQGQIAAGQWVTSGITNRVFTTSNVCDGNWHWLELRVVADNTTGSIDIYVDGVLEDSYSGDTIQNPNSDPVVSGIRMTSVLFDVGATDFYIDDLVVYDDAGSGTMRTSVDFPVGPLKIETLRPNSTGANADFTSNSTAANWENVDETGAADEDTSYNSSTSYTAVDTFGMASISSTDVSRILGAVVNGVARKDGANTILSNAVVISSGSTGNGPAAGHSTGYTGMTQYFLTEDPATSTRWTTAGLDAAEFGYATSSST